jgi:hypothetical protein
MVMIDTPGDQTKFFHSATENMVKYARIYLGGKYKCFQYVQQKNLLAHQRKTIPVFYNFSWLKLIFTQYNKYKL